MMDFQALEDALEIKQSQDEDYLVSLDKWQLLKQKQKGDGATWLMLASKEGHLDFTELLLKCGVDVNVSDYKNKRAIDYAIGRNRLHVALMLFQWDSLLPDLTNEIGRKNFFRLLDLNPELKRFFKDRDDFHEKVRSEDIDALEEAISSLKPSSIRYCVDRSGHSALYTAANEMKLNSWALLRSKGFDYTEDDKLKLPKPFEIGSRKEFDLVLNKYFIPLDDCHVYKMMAKSRVLGSFGDGGRSLKDIYEKVNEVPMTSLLLKCLQDVRQLEVIFDANKNDSVCADNGCTKYDLCHANLAKDRVYVPAGEECEYSDVIAVLVHELCHITLHVLFKNCGLPYEKDDAKSREKYERILSSVRSAENIDEYEEFIRRTKLFGEEILADKLIACVPSVVIKHHLKQGLSSGVKILQDQVPDLLHYYLTHVFPIMEKHVKGDKMARLFPAADWFKFPNLLSRHRNDHIAVSGDMGEPKMCLHKSFRVHRVSNLPLGISHLEMTLGDVVIIDWPNYVKAKEFLDLRLAKGIIKNMAIVWEEGLESEFYRHFGSESADGSLERSLQPYSSQIVFIFPKIFGVLKEIEPHEYVWNDMSDESKSWVSGRTLIFQGKRVALAKILTGAVDDQNSVEMNSLFGADGLNLLIDREDIVIGRPLESTSTNKSDSSFADPQRLVPRSLRVRPLMLDKELFEERTHDVFFVADTDRSHLEKAGLTDFRAWNWEDIESEGRLFLLSSDGPGIQEELFERVVKRWRETRCTGDKGLFWQYIHFFSFVDAKWVHHHSVDLGTSRVVIVAERPGNDRSHFFKMTARAMKESCPGKWVEMFATAFLERELNERKMLNLASDEILADLFFDFTIGAQGGKIKREHLQLEKRIFKLLCRSPGLVNIFIDDFDELDIGYSKPLQAGRITPLLEAFIRVTNVRVFLITGMNDYDFLESHFSALTQHFVPCEGIDVEQFFNSHWNASLSLLSQCDRVKKLKEMISSLESLIALKGQQEIHDLIRELKMHLEDETFTGVKFGAIAKKFVPLVQNVGAGVKDYSERSLLTLMVACVAFQGNFNIGCTLSLNRLYDLYIGSRIDLSWMEVEKASKSGEKSFASSALRSLKKLSTFLFNKDKRIEKRNGDSLEDSEEDKYKYSAVELLKKLSIYSLFKGKEYKLNNDQIHRVAGTRLVVQSKHECSFVHRTFAEYIFLVWVLGEARNEGDAKSWVTKVLLEESLTGVRGFLDRLLLSCYNSRLEDGSQDMKEWAASLFSRPECTSRKELVDFLQKCLFMAILECCEGILKYLVEISETTLSEVLFSKVDWDIESLNLASSLQGQKWNGITFCGGCAGGTIFKKEHARAICGRGAGFINGMFLPTRGIRMEQLRFLAMLFTVIEDYKLASKLSDVITENGLMWMCIDSDEFWERQYTRTSLKVLLDCLARNKDEFSDILHDKVFGEDGRRMFIYASASAPSILDSFLDAIIVPRSWTNVVLEETNFAAAWTGVVNQKDTKAVERLWAYLKEKLVTQENRKLFFRRKDPDHINAMLSAFMNQENPNVIPLVWDLARSEMNDEECKSFILESFDGADVHFWFDIHRLFDWLIGHLKSSFLSVEEAYRILQGKTLKGEHYLLDFHFKYSPSTFYEWQDIFVKAGSASKEVLTLMKGHYKMLVPSCLELSYSQLPVWPDDDPEFVKNIENGFAEMLPVFAKCPFANSIQQLQGVYVNLFTDTETGNSAIVKIHPYRWKLFLVLFRRQVSLEAEILGKEALFDRLEKEWRETYEGFPEVTPAGREVTVNRTRAILIPYFFAILAEVLSKEEVSRIVQADLYGQTAFHHALSWDDLRAFHCFYDVARWSMGDDALWKVHSLPKFDDRTVLSDIFNMFDREEERKNPGIPREQEGNGEVL
ncbi:uncharacterized protein LOC124161066 [Ischnura elegans]|uniref:uncharacterized protein LOC124161066 n=1 Tax=Ischnura elegans TaxID=197161 RepID=UPI001ED8A426|nr:uncharacterized protein LOC124161066 [Ischnura elegans]